MLGRSARALAILFFVLPLHGAGKGTLSVRVLDREKVPAAGARVFACRQGELRAIRGALDLASLRPVAETTVDAAGWARLSGLPEEELVLAIVRDGERVPSLAGPVRADAQQEQILEDVILPGTGDLELNVAIEEELATAIRVTGLLLRNEDPLWPPNAYLTARYERPATRLTALPAGEWTVAPAVALEGMGSVEAPRTGVVVIAGALNSVSVPSGFRAYRGRLTKAGKAIAGHLIFRPSGETAARLSAARAGADGNFTVPLTAPGEYEVRFQDESGRVMELASPVRFTSPAVRAEVKLGEGRITGIVLGENGEPVEGATVGAEHPRALDDSHAGAYAKTESNGTFAIDGLEPGTWLVVASRGARQSPRTSVKVGAEAATLTLELRERAETSVVVTTAAGRPAAEAVVAVTPVGVPGGVLLHSTVAHTNPSGIAKLRGLDRSSVRGWNVAVRTRDGAVVSAMRAPADEIRIVLPPATGTLVLKRESGAWPPDRYTRLIAPDGSSFAPLWAATPTEPGTLVAARMPPGIWRLAETTSAAGAHAIEAGLPGTFDILGSAAVVPGGTSEILIADDED